MRRLLALLMLCPSLVLAQVNLRFAEETNWPPFTPAKDGQVHEGLAYAMLSEIARRAGFSATLDLYPQKRMEQMVRGGDRDGVTVISRNTDREGFLVFSDPLFAKQAYFYHRKNYKFDWSSYADLKGLRIGVVRGHNLGDDFAAAVIKHGLVLDEASTVEANFRKLMANRVDVLMANHWSAVSLLAQREFRGEIIAADKPYFNKSYHVGLSQKSDAALAKLPRINEAIKAMKQDGTLDNLIQKYLYD